MSIALRTTAQSLRRLSFTFAADGSHAACLAAGADGGWYAESWELPAGAETALPTALPLPGNRSESLRSQLVSLPDGRVLLCRHDGDRHELLLISADPATPNAHWPPCGWPACACCRYRLTVRQPAVRWRSPWAPTPGR